MYRGTTPTLILKVPKHDLTDKTVFVSIQDQTKKTITKTGSDLIVAFDSETEGSEYSLITCILTQEDTLAIQPGNAVCQIRFIDSNGIALATKKAHIDVEDVIYKAVIAHGS